MTGRRERLAAWARTRARPVGRLALRHPAHNRSLRALWKVATLPAPFLRTELPVLGSFEVELPDAGRVALTTAGEDWLMTTLYWHGVPSNEVSALRIFRRLALQSRVVLDVGANVGLFTAAASLDNHGTPVHALEPLPSNFQILEEVVRHNRLPDVRLHELALSDTPGRGTLYVPRAGAANTRDASIVEDFRDDCDAIDVPVTTLDAFAEDHGLAGIDLIKIDVESAEYLVLAGGEKVLDRDRPVLLCEVLRGTTEDHLHEVMRGRGYGYHWISGDGLVELDRPLGDPEYRFRDYLFVPEEKRERLLEPLRDPARPREG
jgi:FkbM family methyltransferase